MNKKVLYYYVGALLIIAGCVGYYMLGYIDIALVVVFLGIALVLLSSKQWWLKALTILLLPPISVFGFVILLFALSNEAL